MRLLPKVAFVVIALILVGVAIVAVHRHRVKQTVVLSQLYNGVHRIPRNAPRISSSELSQLVSADFSVVTDLRYLSSDVKESFCNVEHCEYEGVRFDMVNPGDRMSTDYILPGVPNKRLVFAAVNQESAIVVYERGGYANFLRAMILDFKDGSAWNTTLNSHSIRNLRDLRTALAQEHYTTGNSG